MSSLARLTVRSSMVRLPRKAQNCLGASEFAYSRTNSLSRSPSPPANTMPHKRRSRDAHPFLLVLRTNCTVRSVRIRTPVIGRKGPLQEVRAQSRVYSTMTPSVLNSLSYPTRLSNPRTSGHPCTRLCLTWQRRSSSVGANEGVLNVPAVYASCRIDSRGGIFFHEIRRQFHDHQTAAPFASHSPSAWLMTIGRSILSHELIRRHSHDTLTAIVMPAVLTTGLAQAGRTKN